MTTFEQQIEAIEQLKTFAKDEKNDAKARFAASTWVRVLKMDL